MIPEIQLAKTLEVFLQAVKEGNVVLFEMLFDPLAKQVDLSQFIDGASGQNLLHTAVFYGHVDLVKPIKEKYPELVHTKTKNASAQTPLEIAKEKGFKACIAVLDAQEHSTSSSNSLPRARSSSSSNSIVIPRLKSRNSHGHSTPPSPLSSSRSSPVTSACSSPRTSFSQSPHRLMATKDIKKISIGQIRAKINSVLEHIDTIQKAGASCINFTNQKLDAPDYRIDRLDFESSILGFRESVLRLNYLFPDVIQTDDVTQQITNKCNLYLIFIRESSALTNGARAWHDFFEKNIMPHPGCKEDFQLLFSELVELKEKGKELTRLIEKIRENKLELVSEENLSATASTSGLN